MALLGLQPPSAFLECPGEPKVPFGAWKKLFDNYLLAIGGSNFAAERKRALLIHCLGTEGQRLYNTLPLTDDSYDGSVAALQTFFTPKVNVVAERYRFRQRAQAVGESIDHYLAALRELAKTCAFGNMEGEMLRDQIIEKINMPRIRERLLSEPDITLDKTVMMVRNMETAMADAKTFMAAETPVNAVYRQGTKNPIPRRKREEGRSGNGQCYRCGSSSHIANDQSCPAKNSKCNTCGKIGHFARVCRSAAPVNEASVNEVELPEVHVLCVNNRKAAKGKLIGNFTLATQKSQIYNTDMLVDTGSGASIIPLQTYMEHFKKSKLGPPTVRLQTYSKHRLPVLGRLEATVTYQNRSATGFFNVVEAGTPLIGLDLCEALDIEIKGGRLVEPSRKPVMDCAAISQEEPSTPSMGHEVENGIGHAKNFVHKVQIRSEVRPVRQKLRRLPVSVRQAVTTELRDLENQGIIEKIDSSEWVSPIVVTSRKNGKIRVCVDMREPNKAVVPDSHPLPLIEDLLSELRGSVMFSTLDLKSAYHQLELHKDSRGLTAFITHEGLYQYCRVPYGLSSAPAAFQKMMKVILCGLQGVQCYLDDVIVYGSSQAAHDTYLQAVLHRVQDAGLKLNTEKCLFRQTALDFLGFRLSPDGLEPNDSHVTAILHAPAPTDAPSLRSFLGLSAWYSKFIPNYASVVEPMRALLRKNTEFTWTEEAQQSFEQVKHLITSGTALKLFDPNKRTVVSTDASDYGLGAVLTQVNNAGEEETVAFASRSLSDAERKYSIVEKEALACVWAAEKWRVWLWGRKFLLRTDHQALTTLLTTKGNNRAGLRIARWSARLLEFNYDVEYRPGSENDVADCLSRLPLPGTDMDFTETVESVAAIMTDTDAIPLEEFKAACHSCPVLAKLCAQIPKPWPGRKSAVDPDLQPYYMIRDELSIVDDCIVRGTYRLVVPESLQKQLIDIAHETHQGIVRTKQRLRELYWWPRMDRQVDALIKECTTCRQNDKSAVTHNAPLQPVPLPAAAWEKVGIDIVGPFENAPRDCRFAITLVDYYSKWPEVSFVSHVDTAMIIQFLTAVFSREGNVKEIVSDNGVQFTSAEFKDYLKQRGIAHLRVSVYYPRANGEVERFNKVLKDCLQTASIQGIPWKSFIRSFLMDYRATPHATTGVSPSYLLHGRQMRTKLQIQDTIPGTVDEGAVRERVKDKQDKVKQYTDVKRHAKDQRFQPGDLVRVRKPWKVKKGEQKFTDPHTVVRQKRPHTYLLDDGRTWNASRLSALPVSDTTMDMDRDLGRPQPEVRARLETNEQCRPQRDRNSPAWAKDYVLG